MALIMGWALGLCLWAGGASAQTGTLTTTATPATAPAAVKTATAPTLAGPIAVADILARADEDQQRVDWAVRLLATTDPVAALRRELDGIARPVDAKLANTAGGALRELPAMRLESLARHWDFDARRFERWEAQARRTLAPYAESALQLAQRRTAWSATRAEGLMDGLPPAMQTRVDGMLAQIDASEAALGTALARQFDLMQRASALNARIQAGAGEVQLSLDDLDRRLLQTEVPPLWLGLGPRMDTRATLAAMHRGLDIESRFAVDYHAATTGNQQALRIVQILLLPLIVWLVLRSRRAPPAGAPDMGLSADGGPEAGMTPAPVQARVKAALRRPLSTWLLLSMLAVLVLEPDAPLLVQEFALLIALVPVLRLQPAGTLRALGAWPYGAVALYALDRIGGVVVVDTTLYRLFLLGLSGLALGLTVWLLRRTPATDAQRPRDLQRGVRPLCWAVLAVLGLSLAANIAGNVSLAEALTSGVIDSGYMALLLHASVAACLAILHTLLGQPELARRRFVRRQQAVLQSAGERLLVLGAVIGWGVYTLDRFRVLRPLHSAGTAVLGLGIEVGEVSIHLGDVLVFVLSAGIALYAARGVRGLLRDELPSHAGLPRGLGNSIASLSYYGVLLLGLLVALSAAGFKVSQLALVFGALGVGIGFGLQNVVNNFVSGLVLMFERPIQPGDVVEAAGSAGTVREIGLRATILRTADGADVVVPNGLLLSGNLTNWTMFDRTRRIELTVRVAYGADTARVLAVLEATARATPAVAAQPAPAALLEGYGDSGLAFVLRAWTQDLGDVGTVRSDLLARLLAALQAAGITVALPQMEVHLHGLPARDGVELGDMGREAPAH